MKFNPAPNAIYHFSLSRFSEKSWPYQSRQMQVTDSVYIKFCLQKDSENDTLNSCTITFNLFRSESRFKVNYQRDSAHAVPIRVAINDSGQVESVDGAGELVRDVKNDSATGKYMGGLIPDQVSESAITDMLNLIFSEIPARKIKVNDTWITDLNLITNHPVHISNFNVLKSLDDDTATISIESNVFERRSPGDESYINGKRKGVALVNYSTGIPYLYETESNVVTTTSYYDIRDIQSFTLKLDSSTKVKESK